MTTALTSTSVVHAEVLTPVRHDTVPSRWARAVRGTRTLCDNRSHWKLHHVLPVQGCGFYAWISKRGQRVPVCMEDEARAI
jgi:hypothetical protein